MVEKKSNAVGKKRNAALEAMEGQTVGAETEAPLPERPQKPVKTVTKVMLYIHPKVARKMKEIAFAEERKTNDVFLDAVDNYLKLAGHRGSKYVIEH